MGSNSRAADASLFERERIGAPRHVLPLPSRDTINVVRGAQPRFYRRLEHLESMLGDLRELHLMLPPVTLFSMTGSTTSQYTGTLWVESQSDLQLSLADRIQWTRNGDALALEVPEQLDASNAVFFVDVGGPADRPVTLAGPHAAAEVYGVRGSISVACGQGRIAVLDCSADVEIVEPADWVIWSGHSGHSRIQASSIDLMFTDRSYSGSFHAAALESIRVFLPRTFNSGIQVDVHADSEFICRADLAPQFTRRENGGRVRFTSGSVEPAVRLTCRQGTVVIDNTP